MSFSITIARTTPALLPALRETSSGETRFTRTSPEGPLDPLKHQIDIADLQDTRDHFAFDRLILDPDGDGRVTCHLRHDRLQLLVIENELTLRPGQSLAEVLLGDELFGCARRRTQRGKRLSLTSDGNIRCQLKTPYRESLPESPAPPTDLRRACSTDESTKSNGSTQDAAHIQPAGICHARRLDWQRMSGK